ncbi:hypothetical protein PTKU64_54470 [Paraburkholderia terrae]|uniref:Uncharacterized protein n=1 Tax=Paraburkholderia terrae TaxID=311230 RepID=A0ABN6JLK6_9BURK|nr:hypothetical protein [Paraburkholderia terrae]BCZ81772.1 hypothetical protein PTKU64_54470 [Paraburkholderia terrae]
MKEDVEALIKANPDPSGLVVRAQDGRLFFITNEQAEKAEIPETGLYVAYLASRHHNPAPYPTPPENLECEATMRWLDTHNPNTRIWRRVSLFYFDHCT